MGRACSEYDKTIVETSTLHFYCSYVDSNLGERQANVVIIIILEKEFDILAF